MKPFKWLSTCIYSLRHFAIVALAGKSSVVVNADSFGGYIRLNGRHPILWGGTHYPSESELKDWVARIAEVRAHQAAAVTDVCVGEVVAE